MIFEKSGDQDTICALSTPPGVGGIAVIRVSGEKAVPFSRKLCQFLTEHPESHRVYFGLIRGNSGESIDEVVVTHFGEGRSFTGESTIEISCHGSPVLASTILKELVFAGCRMARAGEFTYRAFMNGRLDLVQAESVLSLIESQSRQSAKVALRQLQGHLSVDFGKIEDDLLWILAQLEANIDFSAEGLEVTSSMALLERGKKAADHVLQLVSTYSQGRLLRDGLQIALVGKPNAGKSSLMNALLKEDRSIVTSEAGTTRDLVEGRLSVSGLNVTFVDTAGLRDADNEAERIGVQRSKIAMDKSDFVFFVVDISSPEWRDDLRSFLSRPPSNARVVFNKIDLDRSEEWRAQTEAELEKLGYADAGFWVSATSARGLADVESFVRELVKSADTESSNVIVQARHLEQLQKIHSCLVKAIELIKKDSSPEFIAFELQEAIRAIHELLGKEFHEQVIDRIFKEFCLGK